ncbi:MAG: hypothetical protein C0506_13660 [Anaerolinea sp.]|nr:hypothetical protein [Anaerolinea sp.]
MAIAVAALLVGCGGDSSVPATSTAGEGIAVTDNSVPAGTYATIDEAVRKASELAGFPVLPVSSLPAGFSVSGINIVGGLALPSPGLSPRSAQVFVRSDNGGLLITQANTRVTFDANAEKIETPSGGEYYATGPADSRAYSLVTGDRTFTVLTRGNITQAQAIDILGAFRP